MAKLPNAFPDRSGTIPQVRSVRSLGGHRLKVWFSDGAAGEHDFSAMVSRKGPMVEPLRDPTYFARVFVEWGAPTWPNGFDVSPEALHQDMERAGELKPETA